MSIEIKNCMSEGWFNTQPQHFSIGIQSSNVILFLLTTKEDSIEGIKHLSSVLKFRNLLVVLGYPSTILSHWFLHQGTNGTSNGIVPMLRVFDNTADT